MIDLQDLLGREWEYPMRDYGPRGFVSVGLLDVNAVIRTNQNQVDIIQNTDFHVFILINYVHLTPSVLHCAVRVKKPEQRAVQTLLLELSPR